LTNDDFRDLFTIKNVIDLQTSLSAQDLNCLYQPISPSVDEDENNFEESYNTHLSNQYTDINKMHHLIDKTNPAQNMVILSINI